MLVALGKSTYLILTVHSGTLKLSTQNGLCPLGVFIYPRAGMWVRPICILLAWNPIQTPLGKTQHSGWQSCNVAKDPRLVIGKPGFESRLSVCLSEAHHLSNSLQPSGNQFFLYLIGKLESQKTSLNFSSVPGCSGMSHSPLNIDFSQFVMSFIILTLEDVVRVKRDGCPSGQHSRPGVE